MLKKGPFVHKILDRLDKIDTESVRKCVYDLVGELEGLTAILDEIAEGVIFFGAQGQIEWINQSASDLLDISQSVMDQPQHYSKYLTDENLLGWLENKLKLSDEARITETLQLYAPREQSLQLLLFKIKRDDQSRTILLLRQIPAEWSAKINHFDRLDSLLRLAAGIAHEIGNPLNSISIHLNLLKKNTENLKGKEGEIANKHINVLFAETQRLDHIIKSFLKATRKPPLRFKQENLNHIIDDALNFIQHELDENKIKMTFKQDTDLPTFLLDRERIYQAVLNLIKNSIEALPSGGEIKVQVHHKHKVAFLRFQDNGTGIKQEDLPHIFDAYFTTKTEGSGLGLMTVYNTVREHGGSIEVASQPGEGARFEIALPIRNPKLQLPNTVNPEES